MRNILVSIAFAAGVLSLTAPSFAKAPNVGSDGDQIVLTRSADGGKLCTAPTMVTGSILPHKICKTRAEWIAAGATVKSGS